jgi:hypothetical protein
MIVSSGAVGLVEMFASVATMGALFFAGFQLRTTRRTARAEFAFQLYEVIQQYNDIHTRLENEPDYHPETVEEWSRIDRYMGMFETIQVLAVDSIFTVQVIDHLYGHRLAAITSNAAIRERNLKERSHRWPDFLALINTVEVQPMYKRVVDDLAKRPSASIPAVVGIKLFPGGPAADPAMREG